MVMKLLSMIDEKTKQKAIEAVADIYGKYHSPFDLSFYRKLIRCKFKIQLWSDQADHWFKYFFSILVHGDTIVTICWPSYPVCADSFLFLL
jgi:hypothetical protein